MNKNRMNTIVKMEIAPDTTTKDVFNAMFEFVKEYQAFSPAFYKKSILSGIKFGYEVNSCVFAFVGITEEMLGELLQITLSQGVRSTLLWEDLDGDETNRVYYMKLRWADEPEDPEVPVNNGGK